MNGDLCETLSALQLENCADCPTIGRKVRQIHARSLDFAMASNECGQPLLSRLAGSILISP